MPQSLAGTDKPKGIDASCRTPLSVRLSLGTSPESPYLGQSRPWVSNPEMAVVGWLTGFMSRSRVPD